MLDLDKLIIPENTKFEEGCVVSEGDIVICPGSSIGYGLIGKTIVIGEKVKVEGDIVGDEVRIDAWCNIKGNVVSKGEAYIGEFTNIEGKLTVFGDLDIGRNVKIKEGFEARGLITIQDPLPVIIFIFFYLLELLRLGRLEEAEQIFEDIEEFEKPIIIPENSVVDLNQIKTGSDILIEKSRVLGNIRAKDADIKESEVFGSVRGKKIVVRNSKIHGAVEGDVVIILKGSEIVGHVKAGKVYVEENCVIEGTIVGKSGVIIKPEIEVEKILESFKEKEVEEEGEEKVVEGLNKPEIDEEAIKAAIESIKSIKAVKPENTESAIEVKPNPSLSSDISQLFEVKEPEKKRKLIRKDPFKFDRPDKIPSAREKIEDVANAVNLLKSIKKSNEENENKSETEVK